MYTQFDIKKCVLPLFLIIALLFPSAAYAAGDIPEFNGAAVIELSGNSPAFLPEDLAAEDYAVYSELDALGRVGPASACISRKAFPAQLRAESGDNLPVGWQTVRYDDVIDGRYLYSLCHLIAPALSGAGSDARNVFTGTRYLHSEIMRPYEEMIEDFLRRTAYHVLYRVTPCYHGDELVPFGVQMEAYSVEDAGKSVCFNVFAYNIQPGVSIDYQSGDSKVSTSVNVLSAARELLESHWLPPLSDHTQTPTANIGPSVAGITYIVDTQTHRYHTGDCGHLPTTHRAEFTWEQIVEERYTLCGHCANRPATSFGFGNTTNTSSQGGYFADQGNLDKDDIGTRAVSGFLDAAGYSGDDFLGRLRYDDSVYEQAIYGSGSDGFN